MRIKRYTEADLTKVAKQLLAFLGDEKVVLLKGDLGAGKTTLIKSFIALLGDAGEVTSPTYSIINEYHIDQSVVYHMDLYRLRSPEEALDIGIEDYLNSGNYCFIEWPELIADLLPRNFATVEIEKIDEISRKMHIFKQQASNN